MSVAVVAVSEYIHGIEIHVQQFPAITAPNSISRTAYHSLRQRRGI